VHPTTQQLQVVRKDEQDARRHERQQAWADDEHTGDSQTDRAGESEDRRRPKRGRGQLRLQRPSAQLVEGMGGDADRKKESEESGGEPPQIERRGEAGADHNVGEVPRRIRRMQDRPHVAPPTAVPRRVIGRRQVRRRIRHGACGPT